MQPRLVSTQVGQPQALGTPGAEDPLDRPWTSGFIKLPVAGPVWLTTTNLTGDAQADLAHHGGPEKAVLAYSADHYDAWRERLRRPDLPHGAFGENFTVAGITEEAVCIGDVWQFGDAIVQVSQPRQPCWKLSRRWRLKTLALQVQETGQTGWYFRVLQEGSVATGLVPKLSERPHPQWSVAKANRVMHSDKHDLVAAAELAALPELAMNWRVTLSRRVEQGLHPDPSKRLIGPNEA